MDGMQVIPCYHCYYIFILAGRGAEIVHERNIEEVGVHQQSLETLRRRCREAPQVQIEADILERAAAGSPVIDHCHSHLPVKFFRMSGHAESAQVSF